MKGAIRRERYLAMRTNFSKEVGLRPIFDVADQWPLYAGAQNIERYLFIAELVKRVALVPGDVAEFGCWRGATTSLLAKLLRHTPKLVHAFDTFEGFSQELADEKGLRSTYQGSRHELETMLAIDGLEDAVLIHQGNICKTTHNKFCYPTLSLAYIDCDVYEPCAAALEYIYPRLSRGGIIAFDEYNDPAWPGETRAADEFLAVHAGEFDVEGTPVPQPSLVLVRR